MLTWANSHKQSLKYIIGIIRNKDGASTGQFVDESYLGINGEITPLRIFKPKKAQKTTFILFPGASPFAEDHPGMIGLATTIMNLGYNVFIPRIPPLKALIIKSENVEWFARAYEQIIHRDDVDQTNVAIIGISFGGSLLLKATLDERIKSNPPRSVLIYGSYFDLESGLNFLLTGEIEHEGEVQHIIPNDWGLTVMFHNFLKTVDAGFDTTHVEAVIAARVAEKLDVMERLKANLNKDDLVFIEAILSGKCNPQITKVAMAIMNIQKESLRKISPSSFCEEIAMKIFIMHGANDSMVPYTESVKLGTSLPNNKLLISYIYEHKEISTNSGFITKCKELMKLEYFFAEYFKYNES
jgi:esterase/lipase